MVAFDVTAFEDKELESLPPNVQAGAYEDNPMVAKLKASHDAKRWREFGPLRTKADIPDGKKDGKPAYISEAGLVERYIRKAARELGLGVAVRRSEPDEQGRQSVYYLGTDKRVRRTKEEVQAARQAPEGEGGAPGQAAPDGVSAAPQVSPEADRTDAPAA